jgi:hypothetical protein
VLHEKFGDFSREFNVMNLVRHPVSLVWSGYGQFKDLFRYDINELHWTLGKVLNESREFVFGIGAKYQINLGDFENLAFICAACVMGSLRIDLDALPNVKKVPQLHFNGFLQMEKVTSDPVEYKKFITTLIPGIEVSDKYLDEVFSTGTINQHKHDTKKSGPAERFASWNDWQKEVFLFYFKKYNLEEEYSNLGYDLSFIA